MFSRSKAPRFNYKKQVQDTIPGPGSYDPTVDVSKPHTVKPNVFMGTAKKVDFFTESATKDPTTTSRFMRRKPTLDTGLSMKQRMKILSVPKHAPSDENAMDTENTDTTADTTTTTRASSLRPKKENSNLSKPRASSFKRQTWAEKCRLAEDALKEMKAKAEGFEMDLEQRDAIIKEQEQHIDTISTELDNNKTICDNLLSELSSISEDRARITSLKAQVEQEFQQHCLENQALLTEASETMEDLREEMEIERQDAFETREKFQVQVYSLNEELEDNQVRFAEKQFEYNTAMDERDQLQTALRELESAFDFTEENYIDAVENLHMVSV